MTRRTMYKITINYVSPLSSVSDGDGFSGLELARVKLNPRHRCGVEPPTLMTSPDSRDTQESCHMDTQD